jgi:hypothetical protein
MSRISILKHSIRTAAAAFLFAGLLSPAHAANQHDAVSVFPEVSAAADHARVNETSSPVARNRSLKLTSRLPWLAPVGHRQPRRDEVPQSKAASAWELQQQQQLDQELDRKLVICRGC